MNITDIQATKGQEDEWLRVTCTDGAKAWLLYDEVVTVPGIVPSPITGYGDASDITLDQVEGIRAEAEQNAALAASVGEGPIE